MHFWLYGQYSKYVGLYVPGNIPGTRHICLVQSQRGAVGKQIFTESTINKFNAISNNNNEKQSMHLHVKRYYYCCDR